MANVTQYFGINRFLIYDFL